MSDKKNLRQEYIELQHHQAPDLWDRIESQLEEKSPEQITAGNLERKRIRSSRYWVKGLAAAACMFIFVSAVWVSGKVAGQKTASLEQVQETVKFAGPQQTAGALETTMAVQETAAQDGSFTNENSPGYETAGILAVDYRTLSLKAAEPLALPPAVKTVDNDRYFSEAVLSDTGLLCQGRVQQVSFEYDEDGTATAISYQIEVNKILYSEDYMTEGAVVNVKSEIDQNAVVGNTVLYALLENRTYLLPLAARDESLWLVFPFAPQIELTDNQEYLFHNGWKSLVNQDSYVVLNNETVPEDTYYDRIYLRKDSAVEDELVSLMEAMH